MDVKDTKPGTVANPTNTSCFLKTNMMVGFTSHTRYLGREIPQGAAGLSSLDIWLLKLFSFPLQASMKKSFGFPTKSWTSQTSVTRDSIFQVLFPSRSRRKLSAVPWLMINIRKQLASLCSFSSVNFLFTLFIP